eukprot:UN17327
MESNKTRSENRSGGTMAKLWLNIFDCLDKTGHLSKTNNR